ncbi:hypothetical protein ACVWZV_009640 [Bradyrhizobium sp. GM5.1]|uniref:hypothetical protein n=1 Tax=Bradyrhizobium sp. CW10 TaxID=2782683 RepID=UPI001FF8064D|nr:hypothetical protein [Bradyrhizobium sp. CW10]MCK1466881.1 hypothetical protein [Bradyrhizobium sp. CW10]
MDEPRLNVKQGAATVADLSASDQEAAAVLRSRHDGIAVWHLLSALGAGVGTYLLPDNGHDRGTVLSETVGSDRDGLAVDPGPSR